MSDIVVGIDGSEGAAEALRWAIDESEMRGWTLSAALAWTYEAQRHPDLSHSHDPDYTEDDARTALDAYVAAALGPETATDRIGRILVCDRPAPGLLAASKDARLLVVSARDLNAIEGMVMGSVSQRCLHHTTVPIAIVRPSTGSLTEGGRIVVGVDGSDVSRRALDWALDEARARGSLLDVVHAWEVPMVGEPPVTMFDPALFEARGREIVNEMLAQADTSGLVQPSARIVLSSRSAAGALIARSLDADLVVVGASGTGGFTGMLVGSVANHVTQQARCPVVVVPGA